MQRAAFRLQVRKDKIKEYKQHHEQVWPEMLEALRRHGWRNYSLFMNEDGELFGYVEAEESLEKCLEGMASEEVNTQWQQLMAPFFRNVRADQSLEVLEPVFFLV